MVPGAGCLTARQTRYLLAIAAPIPGHPWHPSIPRRRHHATGRVPPRSGRPQHAARWTGWAQAPGWIPRPDQVSRCGAGRMGEPRRQGQRQGPQWRHAHHRSRLHCGGPMHVPAGTAERQQQGSRHAWLHSLRQAQGRSLAHRAPGRPLCRGASSMGSTHDRTQRPTGPIAPPCPALRTLQPPVRPRTPCART